MRSEPKPAAFRQLDDLPEPAKIQLSNAVRRLVKRGRLYSAPFKLLPLVDERAKPFNDVDYDVHHLLS